MWIHIELLAIAFVACFACALPGVFLVLRGMSLMADAISHSILFGIATMFLLVQKLHSPFLLIGAALAGMLTVAFVELLVFTKRIHKEVAIGLVFPLFFSIGVLLISLGIRNVHLDTDMVLLGEMAFAPFSRFSCWGYDIGPTALWQLLAILCMNILFIFLFFKELAVSTFDPHYAAVLGVYPTVWYYGLMSITSITAVGVFDVVGAIMVVALMIVPASTAYLLTKNLKDMMLIALLCSCASVALGFIVASTLDVSIGGSIVMCTGIFFFACLTYVIVKKNAL